MWVPAGRQVVIRTLGRAALTPAAAFAVHQLRYVLAFGAQAGVELQRQGHSYLHSVVPWIVLSITVAVGGFLWALGRALSDQRSVPRYTLPLTGLWLACSTALVAIYVSQEFLEGLFATGHPGGLSGIFAHGGWWALPAAACVGLVLATVLHGARWVLRTVLGSGRQPPPARLRPAALPHPRPVPLPRPAPPAGGRSGRGPPLVRVRRRSAATAGRLIDSAF